MKNENANEPKQDNELKTGSADEFLNAYQKDETNFSVENEPKIDLDEFENQLQSNITENFTDLEFLENEKENIRNPDALGKVIKDTLIDQINMQLGVQSGEQFIEKNNGMTADLRKDAHIQTTENFAKGKIATHNREIDYQKRYDEWQANFQKDENGNVITHTTRTGKQEATLKKGARTPFDKDRPAGSKENHTAMDHTVPAAEIIRDAEANAHLSKEEQIAFANSEANLNEMDSSMNASKGDKSTTDWLDNPNANGQKPDEIFDISKEQDKQLRQKDKEARKEYKKVKEKGKERSVKTGKASQKAEAFLMGAQALSAALRSLLVSLIREIVGKFITWLKSKNKKIKTFLAAMKEAIHNFVLNLKSHISNAVEATAMAIVTMIFGPIGRIISSVFRALKQGVQSVREAISYIRNPANKKKSFAIMAAEIGKIVIAGLTVIGGFALSEAIEKGLMALAPAVFGFEIPLFGSVGSIIGLALGALIAGLVGAIILNFIDRLIAKKRREELTGSIVEKQNEILNMQVKLVAVKEAKVERTAQKTAQNMVARHTEANEETQSIMEQAKTTSDITERNHRIIQLMNENQQDSDDDFDNLMNTLQNM